MKARILTFIDRIFYTPKALPPGSCQTMLELDGKPYRLHLRIESEGIGMLIINASTVLHLNPTATEIAYHLINKTAKEQIVTEMVKRYQVSPDVASQDVEDFKIRIETLMKTPDLDPETFLDMERTDRHSEKLTTPIRLDCALTYQGIDNAPEFYAPVDRVKRSLDTEEWKDILNKAWNAGIPHIVFTGGEPTIRPDLVELIQYAEGLGQVTGLITDGTRITDSNYLHSLLNAGLDHLMIILRPEETESWEAIRDSINEDIFLTVHLTISSRVNKQLSDILDKLRKVGVTSLSLSANTRDMAPDLAFASRLASERGFSQVTDLPVPYSGLNPFTLEMEEFESSKKGAGHTWLYVEPDGDVLAGQGSDICLGNLLTDQWESISANRKLQSEN